jgi:hypothetical protein
LLTYKWLFVARLIALGILVAACAMGSPGTDRQILPILGLVISLSLIIVEASIGYFVWLSNLKGWFMKKIGYEEDFEKGEIQSES